MMIQKVMASEVLLDAFECKITKKNCNDITSSIKTSLKSLNILIINI